MDVMIDAYNRTGDSKYSDLFDKWYVGIKAKNGGSYWNNFYDDMEWIALTMIRLYEVTDENKYLETSQEMWNEIKTGWNDYAGGGIAWTHDQLWSKNACSNGREFAAHRYSKSVSRVFHQTVADKPPMFPVKRLCPQEMTLTGQQTQGIAPMHADTVEIIIDHSRP